MEIILLLYFSIFYSIVIISFYFFRVTEMYTSTIIIVIPYTMFLSKIGNSRTISMKFSRFTEFRLTLNDAEK